MQKDSLMNRREAARLLLGSALAAGGVNSFAAPIRRPNIVFILLDDLRWDALGCTGHPFVKTPNIDRIAREGALFDNFFVTTSLCSPSRASILTGQYAHRHGVTHNGNNDKLSHQLVTFPRLLHDAGYETAFIGKWHMGDDDTPRPGFDHWVAMPGQGAYQNPALNINGRPIKEQGYMTDVLNRYAAEYLNRSHAKPFVLYLGHKAPHAPSPPAERHKELYSNHPIPRRPNFNDTLEGKPALLRRWQGKPPAQPDPQRYDPLIRNQLGALMAIDEGVGQIFQALEKSGQLDNTLLVFTSDNGFFWGEHTLGDKRYSYEESIRDPLLMRYPRLTKAGTNIDQQALNIDLAPTFLDAAGVRVPAHMQGRSLLPLLKGNDKGWRQSFLMEYFIDPAFPQIPPYRGVRTSRWKYTHYVELESADELYDLQADPYEMKNLINDPAAARALKDMKEQLARLL
jgi:N-acetylglucosamine-6-sulfatase